MNVKKPEGLAALKKLIAQADVIIENSETGTMEDMGVGWETIRSLNPRAILVTSQLIGSRGPWASWIGYGPSTQPVGGLVHLWNYDDQEAPAGSAAIFPDHLVGRVCALGAMAALLRRERSGRGSLVEVAQIEAVTGMLGELLLEGRARARLGEAARQPQRARRALGRVPVRGRAAVVRDHGARRRGLAEPARGAGRSGLGARRGVRHRRGPVRAPKELDAQLGAWTATQPKRELAALLQRHAVPCRPRPHGHRQLDDPHFQAWRYAREVEVPDLGRMSLEGPCWSASAMADADVRPPPRLGEHTREIARRLLGYSDAEIEQLVAAGALEDPPSSAGR